MPSNLLKILVEELLTVLLTYDRIEVHRSSSETGTYAEVTAEATRPVLSASQVLYLWEHAAGLPLDWYKTRWRKAGTGTVSEFSGPFRGTPLYTSVAEVRAEGVPVTVTDARILSTLDVWQQFIDRVTRQWFYQREMTLTLDGTGTTLLQLPVPVISLTSMFLNGSDAAADATTYEVYTARRNPRVKLLTSEGSIFEGTGEVNGYLLRFEVGERNQTLVGTFGCVDEAGLTPAPISHALRKLAIRSLTQLYASGGAAGAVGPVIEEETDRHRKRWGDGAATSGAWSTTGDFEVDQILASYRAPISVRAPRTLHRRMTGGYLS